MKITRAHELPPIDAAMIKAVYEAIKHTPKDGQWRSMKGVLRIKHTDVLISCDYVLHRGFLSVENLDLNFPDKSLIIH